MSANSRGEKSEKPTAGKLRKAKDKGEIPRAKDVTMAAGLTASFITISACLPYYRELVEESFISVSIMAGKLDDANTIQQVMLRNVFILLKFLVTLLPIPASIVIASLIPGGWNFTPGKVIPDFKKLNPIQGLKRIISANHFTDVLRMIAKCILLLMLLYSTIQAELGHYIHLQTEYLAQAIQQGFSLYHHALLSFIAVLILFAAIDIPLSKHLFTKKMKMTKQEVKEEQKNNEGNPQTKSRFRQLQRQFAMGQINNTVPQADVVLTNPTHYAVALIYDPDKAKAPYIIAKGVNEIALYIREVAQKSGVEVIEFPTLTRAIYHTTKVNQQIPSQLYRAIAHVLTYVIQLKSWRAGQNDKPLLNKHVQIPKEVFHFNEQQ